MDIMGLLQFIRVVPAIAERALYSTYGWCARTGMEYSMPSASPSGLPAPAPSSRGAGPASPSSGTTSMAHSLSSCTGAVLSSAAAAAAAACLAATASAELYRACADGAASCQRDFGVWLLASKLKGSLTEVNLSWTC